MTLRPVNVEQFGGLNLRDDPEEVGLSQAIDLLNVDFDRYGRIRSRDGCTVFTTNATATSGMYAFYDPTAGRQLVVESNGTIKILSTAGAVVSTSAATTGDVLSNGFASYATPGNNYLYIATTGGDVRRWDGATWFVAGGGGGGGSVVPDSKYLAVQQPDNRLVAVSTTDTARVAFSNAGDPETFVTNNYVDLNPGEGQQITGLVAWNNMIFVFKQTRFYVFYGNSTDGTGQPVFNYRTVDTGIGSFDTAGSVCAGREGVYFIGPDGVYVTTGGTPTKISGVLDPFFAGRTSPFFAHTYYGRLTAPAFRLSYVQSRLYVCLHGDTFVFDPQTNIWTYWNLDIRTAVEFSVVDGTPLVMFNSYNSYVYARYLDSAAATDTGTAITSRYRSGFSDLGYPGQEKTVRETELVGTGTVQFGYARDFGATTSTSQANVTLGTSPATLRKLHRKSQDGELLSWQANSVSGGAWSLNRLTPMIRDVRDPAELTA